MPLDMHFIYTMLRHSVEKIAQLDDWAIFKNGSKITVLWL